QFAERAAARGLQYLAEAQPNPLAQTLPAEACDTLNRLSGSLVQAEQYLDFVRNRTFRRTLLCHDHVPLRRPPRGEAVTALYLTGLVRPVAGVTEVAATGSDEFRGPDSGMWTDDPVLQQLDGTRGRPALIEALADLVASGAMAFERNGAAVRDLAVVRDALRQSLGASLDRIARNALLVAAEGR